MHEFFFYAYALAGYFFSNSPTPAPQSKMVGPLRSDNDGEFISQKFPSLLEKNKIKYEMFAPNSPHKTGTAERYWKTLFEMGR